MESVLMLVAWKHLKASTTGSLKNLPDIRTVMKIARHYGRLIVANAHANWTNPVTPGRHGGSSAAGRRIPIRVDCNKASRDCRTGHGACRLLLGRFQIEYSA